MATKSRTTPASINADNIGKLIGLLQETGPSLDVLHQMETRELRDLDQALSKVVDFLDQKVQPLSAQSAHTTSAEKFVAEYSNIDNSELKLRAIATYKSSLTNTQLLTLASSESAPELQKVLLLAFNLEEKSDQSSSIKLLTNIIEEVIRIEQVDVANLALSLIWKMEKEFDGLSNIPQNVNDSIERSTPTLQALAFKNLVKNSRSLDYQNLAGILTDSRSSDELVSAFLQHLFEINYKGETMVAPLQEYLSKPENGTQENLINAAFLLGRIDGNKSGKISLWPVKENTDEEQLPEEKERTKPSTEKAERDERRFRERVEDLAAQLTRNKSALAQLSVLGYRSKEVDSLRIDLGNLTEGEKQLSGIIDENRSINPISFLAVEDTSVRKSLLYHFAPTTTFHNLLEILKSTTVIDERGRIATELEKRSGSPEKLRELESEGMNDEDRKLISTCNTMIDEGIRDRSSAYYLHTLNDILRIYKMATVPVGKDQEARKTDILQNANNPKYIKFSNHTLHTKEDVNKILNATRNDLCAHFLLQMLDKVRLAEHTRKHHTDTYKEGKFVRKAVLPFLTNEKPYASDITIALAYKLFYKHGGETEDIPFNTRKSYTRRFIDKIKRFAFQRQ